MYEVQQSENNITINLKDDKISTVGPMYKMCVTKIQSDKCQDHSGRADYSQTKGCKGCGCGLKCMYVNARSVMNKSDYLCAEVQTIDPDVIHLSYGILMRYAVPI